MGADGPGSKLADVPNKALTAEYETEIHFQKCYGVIAEIFELHSHMRHVFPNAGFRFLDLGCAPGGFSSFLLNDPRCRYGYGVTLPTLCGGFPVRVRSDRFFLQHADLFEVGVEDLLATEVNICICDAQYLRNSISWDEHYRGVRCRSKQHGVWALLMKQLWLGLTHLADGGICIFRFGWRDPGPEDTATVWYKRQSLRLFTLMCDFFETVKEVKSDHFNALQSSFYVCCMGFRQQKFKKREGAKLLGLEFTSLLATTVQNCIDLEILAMVDMLRTPELDEKISDMLDRINKLRLINQESSWRWQREQMQRHEVEKEGSQDNIVYVEPISPAAEEFPLTDKELSNVLGVYGRIVRIKRDVGLSSRVGVQFSQSTHERAVESLSRHADVLAGVGLRLRLSHEGGRVPGAGVTYSPVPPAEAAAHPGAEEAVGSARGQASADTGERISSAEAYGVAIAGSSGPEDAASTSWQGQRWNARHARKQAWAGGPDADAYYYANEYYDGYYDGGGYYSGNGGGWDYAGSGWDYSGGGEYYFGGGSGGGRYKGGGGKQANKWRQKKGQQASQDKPPEESTQ